MQTEQLLEIETSPVPQLKVRTGLRGGSLEACEAAVKDWKTSYDKWYMEALSNGRLKAPSA